MPCSTEPQNATNLQLLIEACIRIAKQRLKSLAMVVPSDACQAFHKLQSQGHDSSQTPWNKVIGLRNALVHDYLDLDAEIVKGVIRNRDYRSLLAFSAVLLRIVTAVGGVAAQLPADRAVVDAKLSGDLTSAHAQVMTGIDLVSLGLGQLSVSHALLHFGRWAEKGTGPPASTSWAKVLRLLYESRLDIGEVHARYKTT